MKKIVFIMMIILLIMYLLNESEESSNQEEEIRGVFISYIELQEYVKNKDISISKRNIDKIIDNISKKKFNCIILQVRAGADAIYDSNIFPYSQYVSFKEGVKTFDVLEYFIKKTHQKKMKLFAWINPYRVRTTEDISSITEKSPAYSYLNTDTVYVKNGIYFNPSKEEVLNLIVDGVKEVLNYSVDGILFDDYFYPDNDIDQDDYLNYIQNHSNITKKEYHLNVINRMIEKVYLECHKKNIPFGISPDGNIENNYEKNFADVRKWMDSDKYIDFIMPQVYYGFYNSTKAYVNVIKEWESLLKNKKIDLFVALAFYKVGLEDKYAKDGSREWLENDNIIMREVLLSRNLKNYKGFSLFRYDYIFKEDIYTQNTVKELDNLKKIVN